MAPVILQQPLSLTTNLGARASFFVSAAGDSPLFYQWWFSGASSLVGSASLLDLGVTTSNLIGDYYVIVTNAFGAVTSSVAHLGLFTLPSQVPANLRLLRHSDTSGDALQIAAETGKNFRVQISTDLKQWSDLGGFLSTDALVGFTNHFVTNRGCLFYRVVSP
jgi:hypothetical protein